MKLNHTSKTLFIGIIILFGFLILQIKPAGATVPVDVIKGILNTVEEVQKVSAIDDTDDDPDLQAKIYGDYSGNELSSGGNVGVTKVEKLSATETELKKTLDQIKQNVNNRLGELQAQKNDTSFSSLSSATQTKITEAINDLQKLQGKVSNYSTTPTIALDVNIVNDTTADLQDLKDIAKEQLARTQLGQLVADTEKIYTQASFVNNWKDYIFGEAIDAAQTFLNLNHSTSSSETGSFDSPLLPASAIEAINLQTMANIKGYRVQPDPIQYNSPANASQFLTPGVGSWGLFLGGLSENYYTKSLKASDDAFKVAAEKSQENTTQGIAGQGTKPLEKVTGTVGADGSLKKEIVEPSGRLLGDYNAVKIAVANSAGNPKYAPASGAIGAIDSDTFDSTKFNQSNGWLGVPTIERDVIASNKSTATVSSWDELFTDTYKEIGQAANDVFCDVNVSGESLCDLLGISFTSSSTKNLKGVCSYLADTATAAQSASIKSDIRKYTGVDVSNYCTSFAKEASGLLNDFLNWIYPND